MLTVTSIDTSPNNAGIQFACPKTKLFFKNPKNLLTNFSNGVLNKIKHLMYQMKCNNRVQGLHAGGYGDLADTIF
jgi:hypothetical protein